ncbi:MAG: pyruvate dehydrogenase (acetyl-transferring) E1 component subunit alpha [Alphaproteobacteria bacterium]
MRSIAFRCEIPYTAYLNTEGEALSELPAFAKDAKALIPLYRMMVLTRLLDEKAVSLQRTGRLGTYATALGQEAVGVGTASAMRASDVLVPSFRDQSAQLWRGVTILEHLLYWGGDERGSAYAGPTKDFPVSIPVASHFPHAAGVALALKMKGTSDVALALGGDGSTSKGDFYEAMNVAGAWRLPCVFVINNNGWAISERRRDQTAAETLAQKAVAAGISGEQVDGNDVIAVRDAAERALQRARTGEGPTLIEAVTYRLGDHTTSDDARRYRDEEEVRPHWKNEPIARLRTYLTKQSVWTKEAEEKLLKDCREEVERAASSYLASTPQGIEAMFDFTYANLPADLEAQRAEALGTKAGKHA